eukprot:gene39712-48463_t
MFHSRTAAWFLAQLKRNNAAMANRNLKQQGFSTFLPMEQVTRPQKDKFDTTLRPLFPGYIFVAFDVEDGRWRAINSTLGIARLVSFGTEPATVPLEVISQLILRCDATGKLLAPPVFKPGDQVRMTSGPFAEFVATVEKIAPDERIWVLMNLMGGQTRVAVQAQALCR